MEAVLSQAALQRVAQHLQATLRSHLPNMPIQVQCVVRQAALLVLGQHKPEDEPDTRQIFSLLQTTLQNMTIEWCAESELVMLNQIKLYLRKLGQKQPYATYVFELKADSSLPTQKSEQPAAIAPVAADDSPLDEPFPLPTDSQHIPTPTQRSPWMMAVSSAAFAALLVLGGYAVTRPCVVGSCPLLQTALTTGQQSTQALQTATTSAQRQQAQQAMSNAQQQLKQVPAWSSHRADAQVLHTTLDRILVAETKVDSAIKAEQAARPIAQWQATQSLWREAIAQLEMIPSDNSLYPPVQNRLTTYRQKLATIDQRIAQEQQGLTSLSKAEAAAKIAGDREKLAQTSQDWQLAQSAWQAAMNTLKQIPKETTSYAKAQALLASYQPKFRAAGDRVNWEQSANQSYSQAEALAKAATALYQQNRWGQAAATWRDALNAAKRIPTSSSRYSDSQSRIATYTRSLKQAEVMQKADADLARICSGAPRICTYILTATKINVRFTPAYERALQESAIVGQSGDLNTLEGTIDHLATLEMALQTICNNTGLKLELSNASNTETVDIMPQKPQ
jgi:tetratricopeptide (TPR) repeat protein